MQYVYVLLLLWTSHSASARYVKTHGTCKSVSKDDCRNFSNTDGKNWETSFIGINSEGRSYPPGCNFHSPKGLVWYNEHASVYNPSLCSEDNQCVCAGTSFTSAVPNTKSSYTTGTSLTSAIPRFKLPCITAKPPPDYSKGSDGHFYKFYSDWISWYEAKSRCSKDGGNLAIDDTPVTHSYLKSKYNGPYWIGIDSLVKEGRWMFIDGKEVKTSYWDWEGGQPGNDGGNDEDCVGMWTNHKWHDIGCMTNYPFLCQIKSNQNKGTSFTSAVPSFQPPCNTDSWKLQQQNVCFEAHGEKPGLFTMKNNGYLKAIKLVHLSGYVNCNKRRQDGRTNFGCYSGNIMVFVTDNERRVLFPNIKNSAAYKLSGYTPASKELVFETITRQTEVSVGTKLRVWYGEDLRNSTESDNEGRSCVDVYAKLEDMHSFFPKEAHRIVKGNLLTVIPKLYKNFAVSFDLYPSSYQTNWANVLHMSIKGDMSNYGDRIPAIWFQYNPRILHICSAISGNLNSCYNSKPFPLRKWIQVKVEQMMNTNIDEYEYLIYLNGQTVYRTVNTRPAVFTAVQVYASGPWHNAQDGKIRNLQIYPGSPSATTQASSRGYTLIGCFRDEMNRAISGWKEDFRNTDTIKSCYETAKRLGYLCFAVQDGYECFTSANACTTYSKYGSANGCKNGKGGSWKQDVYKINYVGINDKNDGGSTWKIISIIAAIIVFFGLLYSYIKHKRVFNTPPPPPPPQPPREQEGSATADMPSQSTIPNNNVDTPLGKPPMYQDIYPEGSIPPPRVIFTNGMPDFPPAYEAAAVPDGYVMAQPQVLAFGYGGGGGNGGDLPPVYVTESVNHVHLPPIIPATTHPSNYPPPI